jgi:hypothetical protein
MDDPQSSRFRAFFDSALHDYQRQTGTTLSSHPLAEKIQDCDSVESVTAVLREQARALSDFRGGEGRIMRSLETIVSVLYTLSEKSALGEAIGLVRRKGSSMCSKLDTVSAAILTSEGHFRRICYPPCCMILLYFPRVYPSDMHKSQAVKDVSTSYDALVDLLESMEHLMNRLDIYNRVPSTGAMIEIIVKIMVETISTLALVTKQIKQKRPSECVAVYMPLV